MKHTTVMLVLACSIVVACNQPAKTDDAAKATNDTIGATTDPASMPPYDPDMDPVKVEAAFIKVLADTLNVKFYEAVFKPGDSVALHTHPDNIVYILEGGTLEIKPKDGAAQLIDVKAGMTIVSGPATHSGKNAGSTTIRLLVTDIYRPRS